MKRAKAATQMLNGLNQKHAVVMVGGKCLIMNLETGPSNQSSISFSSEQDFRLRYAHRMILIMDNGKPKMEPIVQHWLRWTKRREFNGIVFDPKSTPTGYYNLFKGLAVTPEKGDWSFFKQHIQEVIAKSNTDIYTWILAWMARIVQDPGGDRPGTSLVLRGPQGVGKGCFATTFGKLFGDHFFPISSQNHVTGRFNQHFGACLLAFLDEGFWAGNLKDSVGTLKSLITEPEILIEAKYKDAIKVRNYVNLIIASNDDWVVPAGLQERRFCVLDVSPIKIKDHQYFNSIHDQMGNGGLEAMLYDLLHLDISNVDLRTIPKTGALFDQIAQSFDSVQKFWFESLAKGCVDRQGTSWKSPIKKDEFYEAYTQHCGTRKSRDITDRSKFWKEFRELCSVRSQRPRKNNPKRKEYVQIPSLKDSRNKFSKVVGIPIPWEEYR